MAKVIIVTGGSRGIGKATIEYILNSTDMNTVVISVARTEEPLKLLQDKFGSKRFQYVIGNIVDENIQNEIIKIALKFDKNIYSLVANAGVLAPVDSITNYNSKLWKDHFDVNFFSIVSLVSKCLPHMQRCDDKRSNNIIIVSSGASVKAYKGWSCYCASKAALNQFTLSLATEMSPKIKAIAVAPGVVATQMQIDIRDTLGPQGMPPDALKRFIDLFDNNQLLDPSVPGHVYGYLAIEGIPEELNGLYVRYNDERLLSYINQNP